MEILDNRYTAL